MKRIRVLARGRLWAAVAAMGAAVLLWTAHPRVGALRREDPKSTAFMRLRAKEAKAQGRAFRLQHQWVRLDRISPHLRRAVVLSEDDGFWTHGGFDWARMRDAAALNLEKGRYAYGASTITQQLARNLWLSPSRTLSRKALEAWLAWRLERELPKRRILEIYLNVVEWGPGVFGAQAAARHWFGKDAADLDAGEAVALAAALPSPKRWGPLRDAGFLVKRRRQLLDRMARTAKS